MYKHVFLSQCVNCKVFPVAFHCDSTREKFDKTNKNSQMNNSEHCAERCPISKVWGSLILEPEAWTVSSISAYKDHSLQEVSQLSLCSRQRRENLHSFHRGAFLVLLHLSAFYPFLRADLKSHCPWEFLTYDASGWLAPVTHFMSLVCITWWEFYHIAPCSISACCSRGPNFATSHNQILEYNKLS